MGVQGLETFLEDYKVGGRQVNIEDLVTEYKRTQKKEPVIVIDAMSIFRFLYGNLSWMNGGQLKEFKEILKDFIQKFVELGCRLVFFLDGPMQERKIKVWKSRRIQTGERISDYFNNLLKGKSTQEIERKADSTIIPNSLGTLFACVISQSNKCCIFKTITECDEEVARYAKENNCFAIMGQDTDYIVYNCVPYYLSVKSLNLTNMTTMCYSGSSLASYLRLSDDELPLLSSLVGNDLISFKEIQPFHNMLRRKYNGNYSKKRKFKGNLSTPHKVILVGKYIVNNRNRSLSDISREVFPKMSPQEGYRLLQGGVNSYDLTSVPDLSERLFSTDSNWSKILSTTEELQKKSPWPCQLYDIVVLNRFTSSTSLEDYRDTAFFRPCGTILKDLRRASYGILLQEKPLVTPNEENYVRELVMSGFNSLDDYVLVSPIYLEKKHPGLLQLWNCNDKNTEDAKWDILSEVFKIAKTCLKNLSIRFLVPVLALKYLKGQVMIEESELDAILACVVCVEDYSASDLSKLPADPIDYRSIWLYNLLTRTYSIILSVMIYIGNPVPMEKILVCEYSDGKLFHEKYRMCRSSPHINPCENKVQHLEAFNMLKLLLTD